MLIGKHIFVILLSLFVIRNFMYRNAEGYMARESLGTPAVKDAKGRKVFYVEFRCCFCISATTECLSQTIVDLMELRLTITPMTRPSRYHEHFISVPGAFLCSRASSCFTNTTIPVSRQRQLSRSGVGKRFRTEGLISVNWLLAWPQLEKYAQTQYCKACL